LDAMKVAASLGIPFQTLDLEQEYKRDVVEYMVHEYRIGRTPNPDVCCNRAIKFGALWSWARQNGADFVATGHYARIKPDSAHGSRQDDYALYMGLDTSKDQSYFLWQLTQDDLSHILFPIGAMKKNEVRREAAKRGLTTAAKKDSQGLCFLGQVDMKEFLSHFITEKPGVVYDTLARPVGTHPGAFFFTIGQRHGFTIHTKDAHRTPLYVIDKDIKENTLIVSPKYNAVLPDGYTQFTVADVLYSDVNTTLPLEVCFRYHGKRYRATYDENTHTIRTKEKVHAACGQSTVLYRGERVVGGGIVDKMA